MKFLLRSLIVLAIAVAFGSVLYYAVRALPTDSPAPSSGIQRPPENPAPRPERPENDRGGGIRWRSILGFARRVIMFSIMVFIAVLGKNFVFERKPNTKNKTD